MKNLTKRTKILLGVAGVVIVVLIAGLVLLGPDAAGLFGTDVIHISPTSATINVDQSLGMSINSMFICQWSSSNENVVEIMDQAAEGDKSITAYGYHPGTATIKANCAIGNRYATVTVRQPPAISFNPPPVNGVVLLRVGQTATASVGTTGTNCTWKTHCSRCTQAELTSVSLSSTIGPTITITGAHADYWVGLEVTCANGTSYGNANMHVVQ